MSFASDFQNLLASEFRRRFKAYLLVESPKEVYIGDQRIAFDIYLERPNKIVIIEVELRREAPLHNVAKTLLWASKNTGIKYINLIQAFDRVSYYSNVPSLNLQLASFLGELGKLFLKDKRNFTYQQLLLDIPQEFYSRSTQPLSKIKSLAINTCDQIGLLGVL